MDRKTYILQRKDKPKPLFVSAQIHHAIKIIAKDMDCSMSEVNYRLIVLLAFSEMGHFLHRTL
jgi:hypothetical protein